MQLQDFYRQVLNAVNVEVGADGRLYTDYGERKPLLIDGEPVFFPSPELLRAGVQPGMMVFHPLSESLVRAAESPVFAKLRSLVTYRLTVSVSLLVAGYLDLGGATHRHRSLPMNAHGVLSAVADVDPKVAEAFAEILSRTNIDSSERLLGLYAKRGGTYRGEKYPQVMVATFPLYEALEETDNNTVFGVSLRKKDIRVLTDVLRYVLPGLEDRETYSAPSSNRTAPMFHALLSSFAKIAKQINKLVNLHREFLEDPSAIEIPTEWVSELDDISQWAGQIPSLPGNEGQSPVAPQQQETAPGQAYPQVNAPIQPMVAAPSHTAHKEDSLEDFLRKTRPQPAGYPPQPMGAVPVPYGYPPQPQAGYGQPVYMTRGGYAVQPQMAPQPQYPAYGYGTYAQAQQPVAPAANVPWANAQNGQVVATQTNPPMMTTPGMTRGGYMVQNTQPAMGQPMGAYRTL